MIEMPRISGQESPLMGDKKQANRDTKCAAFTLLAVVGLAIIALTRGAVNTDLIRPLQEKLAGNPGLCDPASLQQAGYDTDVHADCIVNLPGLAFKPNFRSFSGYLPLQTVQADDETQSVEKIARKEIFYWMVESQENPDKKPLVFWMNGGPGCSGLDGLLSEHGPYLVYSDMTLRKNEEALNKLANVVYFEAPIGVGFSKPAVADDIVVGDAATANDNAEMIRSFLTKYRKFENHEVYIASESYGGHYMPTLAEALLKGIDDGAKPHVNFKGMMVGNPFVDFWGNMRGSMNAYFGHGMVKYPVMKVWNDNCDRDAAEIDAKACSQLYSDISNTKNIGHEDPYALDFTFCPTDSLENGNQKWTQSEVNKREKAYVMQQSMARILKVEKDDKYVACADNYMTKYLNRQDVQTALHAKTVKWALCSNPVHRAWPDESWEFPMQKVYAKLAKSGRIKMLVYSGDDDSVCSTYSTQLWMWNLGLPVDKHLDWKPWYDYDQLGGYQTRFLTPDKKRTALDFTTIHTAGHMVPQTQPRRAFKVYESFLTSNPVEGFHLGEDYQ